MLVQQENVSIETIKAHCSFIEFNQKWPCMCWGAFCCIPKP